MLELDVHLTKDGQVKILTSRKETLGQYIAKQQPIFKLTNCSTHMCTNQTLIFQVVVTHDNDLDRLCGVRQKICETNYEVFFC